MKTKSSKPLGAQVNESEKELDQHQAFQGQHVSEMMEKHAFKTQREKTQTKNVKSTTLSFKCQDYRNSVSTQVNLETTTAMSPSGGCYVRVSFI